MQLTFDTTQELELEELIAIDPIAARDPSRRDLLFSAIKTKDCLSARTASKLVAFAITRPSFFQRPMVELLMVSAHHRQSGIGLKTLEHLVALHAAPTLWTSTNQGNAPMRGLLAKAGFIHSGTIEGLDDGDPEMVFRITRTQI